MTPPTFWLVNDGKGSVTFDQVPPSDTNSFTDTFDSSVKWATTASIISGVVMTVAIVAIVLAIIDCLKKAGSAIPTYARIATSDNDKVSNSPPTSSSLAVDIPPNFPVIRDSEVRGATMERFLSKMAREKPIRFSPQQLQEFTQNFSTVLGSGAFGVVFKGEFPDGVQVAVKVLTNNPDKRIEEQFMAEVSTIGRTYHMNLVRLYGFCFDPTIRALVYEFMEKGSLDRLLFSKNSEIEWQKLNEIAIGTAKGIAYLHEECQQRIIHYDIKPENVLLDRNFNAKVADFGLAKLCNRESSQVIMTGLRGTPGYAAPELWKPYPVTCKCDIYSYGMLLFEIVGRRRNLDANLSETREWLPRWTWEMVEKDELAEMLKLCGIEEEREREKAERMSMVALWCIQYQPEARPTMSTVVKMLEGETEIAPPPYPFQRFESFGQNGLDSGSNENSDLSPTTRRTSEEPSYSNTIEGTLEIELAT
ncbi:unnamed protein product [Ilex paraguariensis]|uniref:non-specific serine/threonine protein kinase n=1 Tax=Ilex paraguariensis TaxID=185542 RepID=A0ABC8TJK8_9AQUA